jgi:cytochrome P450 PksS
MTGSGTPETTPAEASTARTADLNPVSPENLLNPIPFYKTLRETDPVHWSPEVHGWFLTRHEDVMNSFRDSRFSANRISLFERGFQDLGPEILKDFSESIKKQMLMHDGPNHIRMRRQASPSFSPQALDSWLPAIRRTVHMLLDRVQDQRQVDLVPTLSYQLPPRVIAELFGLPVEEQEHLMAWAEPMAQIGGLTVGMDREGVARRTNTAVVEFSAFLRKLIQKRRQEPGNDLLSLMMQTQGPNPMTEDELIANAILMVNAGHMTTTDQLSNLVHDLLAHPDQLRLLQENPRLLSAAVEESLRYRPAVPFHYRIAREDMQLRGKTIRQGDVVFLGIASANRDPAVFTEPDRFDITRDHVQQKHLTFSFGPHHCLGAGIARRELELALEVLLQRMPELRLDPERPPEHKYASLIFRGFNSLHVRW